MPADIIVCGSHSGNSAEQSTAANSLINTAQTLAKQLAPTPVPTPQANFLNLPNINLPSLLGGGSSGGQQQGPNLAALIPGNNQVHTPFQCCPAMHCLDPCLALRVLR